MCLNSRPLPPVFWVIVLAAAVSVTLTSPARAAHCSSDKDHLVDGSCGYFVEPVSSPSPSSTPTPQPTGTPEPTPIPQVRVRNDGGEQLHVTVDNFPTADPGAGSQGWTAEDRETLQRGVDGLEQLYRSVVLIGGLSLLALGIVCVHTKPRVT